MKDKETSREKRQRELNNLRTSNVDTGNLEQIKTSIFVSLIENLEDSLNNSSDVSTKLTK